MHFEDYLDKVIKQKPKDDHTIKQERTDDICDKGRQNICKDITKNYNSDEELKETLYDYMISQKTQFVPVIAEVIIESGKELPPKIEELFKKIETLINR